MHVKMKCCILFVNVLLKTENWFFDCIDNVSLIQIRLGQSSSPGRFSGDFNVLNGATFVLVEGCIMRNKEFVVLVE